MAVLERLYIRGIRSFGPDEEEKVSFSTPLTLFLGQNGCGKTTILECIKYALTGELPAGTDSGRGFINDPKLSNKATTKASIKVKFRDAKGDYITVGKFLEVSTAAGGALKFKSVNHTARWESKSGERQNVLGRCIDIDLYCAQKLNVSKAIINNVIFCHQENSAWPLDEPKKLKEKFDEIFGSTEYNKCVERLRKHIKVMRTDIKVLKEQVQHKELVKKNSEKLRTELTEKEVRLEDIIKFIEDKQKQIEPLEERLTEINIIVESLGAVQQKKASLETRLKGILEQQEALKKHLVEEFDGSDADLDKEILNFDTFQESARRDIIEKEEKRRVIESKIQEINQLVQRHQVTFGKLKQEEAQHAKRCEEMKDFIEKAKAKYDITFDDGEVESDIIFKLQTILTGRETIYKNNQRSDEEKAQRLQQAVDNVRTKLAAAEESVSIKTKLIADSRSKMQEARMKLSNLKHSSDMLDSIGRKLAEAEEALKKKKSEFDDEKEIRMLEALDAQINQKDLDQNKLDREYRIQQQNYVTEQKIESERNALAEKTAEIENLKQKHEEHFQLLFGENLPEEKIENAVLQIQKREERKLNILNTDISNCEKKAASLEAAVKHISAQLRNHKEELSRQKTKIVNVCKGKNFSELLSQSYTKKEKLQRDKGAYRSAKTLFEQFISQFEEDTPCCPVCTTDFSSKKGAIPGIINALKGKIEDLPRKITETESLLKKEEDLYNKLQQLKPANETIEALEKQKIPQLEQELQETSETFEDSQLELASLKGDLVQPEALVETCRKVISDAALIDRLSLEIKRGNQLIETLSTSLAPVASDRSLTDTETELSRIKGELANLRRQYKTQRDFYDETKDSIQRLNARVQVETQKKLEVQKRLQERPLLEKQIHENKQNVAELEKDKNLLEEKVTAFRTELSEVEKRRDENIANNKKLLEKNRVEFEECKRLTEDVVQLNGVIELYEKENNKGKLDKVVHDLEECKTNIGKLEQSKKILNDAIVKSKEGLASQESRLRNLNDNKELRAKRVQGVELQNEIRGLKKQMGSENCNAILEERRRVMDKIDAVHGEINRKTGEKSTYEDFIATRKIELNKKEHRESGVEYKRKVYELKVQELAVADLEQYTAALEKSVLRFHQERMVQINVTIRELWRNIYKGNDIDYIEIKTVDDIGATGPKRRSYTYKVVQVKKGNELEMRGRCSAGQKVLACLVIRMALAETFSSNCGILALDEPTTNLDKDNIMSLSDALSRIIMVREKEKNFQLLIITHDEEFLQTLTRDQTVSHYFKVQRNPEGFSEIKQEAL